jgi:hypothetical protein
MTLRPLFLIGEWVAKDRGELYRPPSLLPPQNYVAQHLHSHQLPGQTPQGTFEVKDAGQAVRCEICHQSDAFDASTGLCSRCHYQTK